MSKRDYDLNYQKELKQIAIRMKPEIKERIDKASAKIDKPTRAIIMELLEKEMERIENMKIFTADRESGNIIEEFATVAEARKAIERYEESDKKDGVYEENFYSIIDQDRNIIG